MKPPTQHDPVEAPRVTIEKPVYGGSFMARLDGKAVFVPLVLPGEQARIRLVQSRPGYSTAETEEILSTAPQRVPPACPHFGACGGCHYQHAAYETQLGWKQAILRETLVRAGVEPPAEISVLAAEPWAYRNRIRVALDAAGNPAYRGRRSHSLIPIRACPIAAPLLVTAAQAAGEIAASLAPRLRPAELALFCNGAEDSLLASVIVSAASAPSFERFVESLRERVPELKGAELVVEPPSKGRTPAAPPRTLRTWGSASLNYPVGDIAYRVDHGAFFQVNRFLVDSLVERVTALQQGHLAWDLFAGVGLFARRLACGFERIIAVESAPAAAGALAANLAGSPAKAARTTALDFLRGAARKDHPDLVVIDPPRTGLGAEMIQHLVSVSARALVYVSCDPATLARDLRGLLAGGFAFERLTMADLFPQTFHLESVVHLRRSGSLTALRKMR